MRVEIKGGADLSVTQSFLNNLWMNALDQHNGGVGMPEIVVIENTGDSSQDLTGSKVEDDGPKYTFTFPAGFSLEPGSLVKLG
jgi:hypothetical protein